MKKVSVMMLVGLLTATTAFGTPTLTIDLKATGVSSGTIENGGKVVKLNTDANSVTMEVWGNLGGLTDANSTNDVLNAVQGVLASSGSAVTGGSLSLANSEAYNVSPAFSGTPQSLIADGVTDLGQTGSAGSTNGVATWVKTGTGTTPTNNFVIFNSTASSQTGPTHLLGTLTLNITGLTTDKDAVTQVQWYWRSDTATINQNYKVDGVSTGKTFGTNLLTGAPVSFQVVPEPASIGLMLLGLGLLRRKH